jgi:hypothetical protein
MVVVGDASCGVVAPTVVAVGLVATSRFCDGDIVNLQE